jgi:hypothetical protein
VSDDEGATWVQGTLPPASALDAEYVADAVTTADGLLALGQARQGDASWETNDGVVTAVNGELDVVAWFSSNGRDFLPIDASALNGVGIHSLTAAATGPAGTVLAIEAVSRDGVDHRVWSWTLDSGFVARDATVPGKIDVLGEVGDGYVAFASQAATNTGRPMAPSAWLLPVSP